MIGDSNDVYNRLIAQLPAWFGEIDTHPILDALLQIFVTTGVTNYNQAIYAELQTRINTYDANGNVVPPSTNPIVFGATGNQLDIISSDFLGTYLPREAGESDNSYRHRILVNVLSNKCTRQAIYNALINMQDVTEVILFEPWNWNDTAACAGSSNPYVSTPPYSLACGDGLTHTGGNGRLGSGSYAYQGFIDIYLNAQGMSYLAGCNDTVGGCNTLGNGGTPPNGIFFYCGSTSLVTTPTTATMIYNTINLTKVSGTICWVSIHINALA